MRAELNAVISLLFAKGIITEAEFKKQLEEELRIYFAACAKDWPEIEFDDKGFTVKDLKAFAERSRREHWPP